MLDTGYVPLGNLVGGEEKLFSWAGGIFKFNHPSRTPETLKHWQA